MQLCQHGCGASNHFACYSILKRAKGAKSVKATLWKCKLINQSINTLYFELIIWSPFEEGTGSVCWRGEYCCAGTPHTTYVWPIVPHELLLSFLFSSQRLCLVSHSRNFSFSPSPPLISRTSQLFCPVLLLQNPLEHARSRPLLQRTLPFPSMYSFPHFLISYFPFLPSRTSPPKSFWACSLEVPPSAYVFPSPSPVLSVLKVAVMRFSSSFVFLESSWGICL